MPSNFLHPHVKMASHNEKKCLLPKVLTIGDEVSDGREHESMLLAEDLELRNASHGSIIIHNFAQHRRLLEASQL